MVKKKIKLISVDKNYENSSVFINFSYTFKNTGLYVLYGPSGCGKTTLLNIICGLVDFQNGTVLVNGMIFNNKVDLDKVSNEISYLTQETYFVDYLTVEENLKLCSEFGDNMINLLDFFNLKDKIYQYPESLSGGERQSLALLQTVLQNKKILLVDEPTASLDSVSKTKIVDLLKHLSNVMLVICSTHDDIIKDSADEVIYFNNLTSYEDSQNSEWDTFTNFNQKRQINLYEYIKKQKKYKKSERKSNVILFIVMCLTLFVCFICNNPKDKLLNSINKQYKLNYFRFNCPLSSKDYCSDFLNNEEIKEFDYVYERNLPNCPYNFDKCKEIGYWETQTYNRIAITLPFNKELFPYHHLILYGQYYNKENQVILGYEEALKYSSNPKSLIGTKIEIKLYNHINEMEIVGIFKSLENESKLVQNYFLANGVYINKNNDVYQDNFSENIFINGKYTSKYINEEIVDRKSTTFNVYYDSLDALFKDYKKYVSDDWEKYENQFIYPYDIYYNDTYRQLLYLAIFLYPVTIISIIIAMLFYFNTKSIEFNFKKHIFSVYQHYGFSLKEIKKATLLYYFIDILKIFIGAILVTSIISFIINYINVKFELIPYQLFTVSFVSIIILFILIFTSLLIMISILFRKLKNIGWYNNIKEREDLL